MDFQTLGAQAASVDSVSRPVVAGRVLQADADFWCYFAANVEEHVNENYRALLDIIDINRLVAGAEFVNVHLTLGMKGGREQFATVKPYQGKRDDHRDPALKERVGQLRGMLANYKSDKVNPVINVLQEADDSITQYQIKRIETHGVNSTVIMSGDKDLWMVEGLHCDGSNGRMWKVQGYGSTEYREVGNVKPKLVGEGTSWFWHQMLMGDTADNIPGLPMLSGELANRYLPTKKYNPNRKPVKCGEAKAVAMLKGVHSDQEAFNRVYEAYQHHYNKRTADAMFLEQAFLLWMRRTGAVLDVLNFLKPLGFTYTPDNNQKALLARFKELALLQSKQSKV